MFTEKSEMISFVKKNDIRTIDLKFTGLFGSWHHISIPGKTFSESVFKKGIGFDAASIPGFKSLESGDMVLIPDPTTAFMDPFWNYSTLSVICDIYEADSKEKYGKDPRTIAAKAEKILIDSKIADTSLWAPEFEFNIFDSVNFTNNSHEASYAIYSEEADYNPEEPQKNHAGTAIPDEGGYHIIPPQDKLYNIRAEIVKHLEDNNIPVYYHHHEVGRPGQSEIEVRTTPLLKMGDWSMMIKYFIRMIAASYRKTATFMPKPLYKTAGNGMHFHQHLFKNGKPLFYDKNGYGGLSKLALSYIAGILKHAPALLALTNPSTNSYRRLTPGFEAPVNAIFSLANRSAAIRIPKYANAPEDKRIEFRPPDGTCNPYLAMAAMLLAGLDGIQKKLDPAKEGFGPIDYNIFDFTEEERKKKFKPLPVSLKEALDSLKKDHHFLTGEGVFTEDIIDTWINYKLEKEYYEVQNRPHPYEMSLYYNI